MTAPKLKKSESLEIRIPFPTKEAFMAKCRHDGLTASQALRALIDQQLETPKPPPKPRKRLRLALGALALAAVGAAAAPSLARSSPDAEFQHLDANRDGQISRAEFRAGAGPLSVLKGW